MIESVLSTQTPTHPMSTVKLFCPQKLLPDVMAYMMKSNVKYWPVERYYHKDSMFDSGKIGYRLEMEANHSIVSYLILKYNLSQLE